MIDETERRLIYKAARKNEDAFTVLWKRYEYIVKGVAYKIIKDRNTINDVAQNVAIILWKKLYTFKHNCNYKSWLYRVSYNEALVYLRRRKVYTSREVHIEDFAKPIIINDYLDSHQVSCISTHRHQRLASIAETIRDSLATGRQYDQIDYLWARELENTVVKRLKRLRPIEASDFIEHHVDLKPAQTISKDTGRSSPSIKSRLHRTRGLLRNDLIQKFGNDILEEIAPNCVNL